MTYKIVDDTLFINQKCDLHNLSDLQEYIGNNLDSIKKIDIQAEIDLSILYLLKKFEKDGVQLKNVTPAYNKLWNSLTQEIPKAETEDVGDDSLNFTILNGPSILDVRQKNTDKQDEFWLQTFLNHLHILVVKNILIVCILFLAFGVSVSVIAYDRLAEYALELDSYRILSLASLRILCPILSTFIITAKSCTAISAVTKSKQITGELYTMSIMNLPANRVYFHPIFCACILATVIINLIAIYSCLFGSSLGWWIKGQSPKLFWSLVSLDITLQEILFSELKCLVSGLWIGFVTCASGLYPGHSSSSIIQAVDMCVVYSFIGIAFIQGILSILGF